MALQHPLRDRVRPPVLDAATPQNLAALDALPLTGTGRRALRWLFARLGDVRLPPAECIASTRLAVDLFRSAGIRSRAMACAVNVYSQELTAKEAPQGRPTTVDSRALCELRFGDMRESGLSVSDGDFDGHVVCLMENQVIVDIGLGGERRPELGLPLQSAAFAAPPGWAAGATAATALNTGCLTSYVARPDDRAFLALPGWTLPARRWRLPAHMR